jgi:hypothetical protein
VLLITLALAFISGTYIKSKPLSLFFFGIMIASFIFIKVMMKYFSRKAIIKLEENKISFDIYKLNKETEEDLFDYSFFDIKSYNIKFPTSRFACLTIYSNSGTKREFSILRRPFNYSHSDTDTVIETIHLSFKEFNITHSNMKVIEFQPSFYASKKGLYTIVFLGLLLIIPISLAIRLDKGLPLTFLGSILLIGQIITRRVADLNFYKKMKTD